ncbi:glyoxalase [Seminavis robusta]|uniref:Glyoxalase n=1 Tax=Seminavis robusta TaxID=568900 RepID=A0A9N8HE01_9STRA|nr:glyoxalase [Seminavis robusta]|eukprot:Sro450_g145460.1 glyoxalase (330) ;mRNA; f:6515-7504
MPRDDSHIFRAKGNKTIIDTPPVAQVLKYHHLGLATMDLSATTAFFGKLGFQPLDPPNSRILRNPNGMQLHLLQADEAPTRPIKNDNGTEEEIFNILQDTPTEKYCGHTHAAFFVPSVAAARKFVEDKHGIPVTGERKFQGKVQSIFIRDLDKITWELERNVGDATTIEQFDGTMLGDEHRRIDHVGTRVSDPPTSWKWYAEMLGFTQEVFHLEHNPQEPLKNFIPWISRTKETLIDINLLINANMPSSSTKNILMVDGVLKPGIIYVAFEVEDVKASQEALKAAGAAVYSEDEVASLGLKKEKLPSVEGHSFFVADPDCNLYRLVQAA